MRAKGAFRKASGGVVSVNYSNPVSRTTVTFGAVGATTQSRTIVTSLPGARADVIKMLQSPVVEKSAGLMFPDFKKLGYMGSVSALKLAQEKCRNFPKKNAQLIIASSNDEEHMDYGELEDTIRTLPVANVLVVKGSSKFAIWGDPGLIEDQYNHTIAAVLKSGKPLALPIRIDVGRDTVLRDIERRRNLGAKMLVTHPTFTDFDPVVMKTLKAIVKENPEFAVRFGALWMSEELYRATNAPSIDQLASSEGRDLYPMDRPPPDGDWERWNEVNMERIRAAIYSLEQQQPLALSTYSRGGFGHPGASVERIGAVIEGQSRESTLETDVEG
ncbi:hypothetical protein [Trinickia dinghuensis]|uniref:hypothetical protein n=1 Tax=Trinickia dinghuensis TaxID=2291023 RepID=UPI0011C029B8|nr:hypothetical protein [Trinickia dinghuensis]